MYSQDRDSIRRQFLEAWRKAVAGESLEPLEDQIAQVIRAHQEYHPLLESPESALSREFFPEDGETNPFLHLGLHLAVLDQVGTDRPPGIRAHYQRLAAAAGDAHEAEHRIMECLAQSLWEAQRSGRPPDEGGYLACVECLAPPGRARR
jgi:hypothetical protein